MLTQVIKTIRTLLPFTGSITQQQIEEAVNNVLMIPLYSGLDKEVLIREIEALYNIRMNDLELLKHQKERCLGLIQRRQASNGISGIVTENIYEKKKIFQIQF